MASGVTRSPAGGRWGVRALSDIRVGISALNNVATQSTTADGIETLKGT